MTACSGMNFLCGVCFHAAHVLGHEKWADEVVMKFDVCSLLVSFAAVILVTPTIDGRRTFLKVSLCSLLLWLLTF